MTVRFAFSFILFVCLLPTRTGTTATKFWMQETDGQLGTNSANTVDEGESSKGSEIGGTRYLWAQSGLLGRWGWGVSPTKLSISLNLAETQRFIPRRGETQRFCRTTAIGVLWLINIYWIQRHLHTTLPTALFPWSIWGQSNRKTLNIYWNRSGGVLNSPKQPTQVPHQ